MNMNRTATIVRETKETSVKIEVCLDGSGEWEMKTGLRTFDHFLSQLAQHGMFDIRISATGSDSHHVVEDVAISLGRTFDQALGERRGIVRMAHAVVPMDDALALVAVDVGGRAYTVVEASFNGGNIGELPAELVRHFFISFAAEARINLHAKVIRGIDNHHQAEALFKALARARDAATGVDERLGSNVPSTKETIDGRSNS